MIFTDSDITPTKEELAAFLEAEKLRKQQAAEYWRQRRELKLVKRTRTPHICECCGETIPPGNQAKTRSVITGSGWPFSIITKYRHVECIKVVLVIDEPKEKSK